MYNFILNMWIMRKIDAVKVQSYVTKGYISQEEADIIVATPKVSQQDTYAPQPNAPLHTNSTIFGQVE